MKKLFILGLLLLGLAGPMAAQGCVGKTVCFPGDELAAGAALNLLSRGPWIAKGWRKPVPRLLWTTALSYGYERYLDWHGFEWSDFGPRLGGYLATEIIIDVIRRKL